MFQLNNYAAWLSVCEKQHLYKELRDVEDVITHLRYRYIKLCDLSDIDSQQFCASYEQALPQMVWSVDDLGREIVPDLRNSSGDQEQQIHHANVVHIPDECVSVADEDFSYELVTVIDGDEHEQCEVSSTQEISISEVPLQKDNVVRVCSVRRHSAYAEWLFGPSCQTVYDYVESQDCLSADCTNKHKSVYCAAIHLSDGDPPLVNSGTTGWISNVSVKYVPNQQLYKARCALSCWISEDKKPSPSRIGGEPYILTDSDLRRSVPLFVSFTGMRLHVGRNYFCVDWERYNARKRVKWKRARKGPPPIRKSTRGFLHSVGVDHL